MSVVCLIKDVSLVRCQSICFVCGKRCEVSEVSECLFCVLYKIFKGVRGQSVCFVCGIRYSSE